MIGGKKGIALVLMFALTGCGMNTSTHKDQLATAEEFCEPNGGVFSVFTELWPFTNQTEETEVYCENGSRFVFYSKGVKPQMPPPFTFGTPSETEEER